MRAQRRKQIVVQQDECDDVQGEMWNLFDWVGTTENLSTETLPLLAKILQLPEELAFRRFKVSKEYGEVFGRDNVTAETVDTIYEMSTLDTAMYDAVRSRFGKKN